MKKSKKFVLKKYIYAIFGFFLLQQVNFAFSMDDLENNQGNNLLKYKTVLTIAGTDPSGGAGMQADLKTFSSLRCYGMSVVTVLLAQNTTGVQEIHSLPKQFVAQQLQSVFDDVEVDAIKIGMLHREEIIDVVADLLKKRMALQENQKIIIDPVMCAKSGDQLITNEAIVVLKEKILPFATILTPNIHETARLLGQSKITSKEEMQKAAFDLLNLGPQAVIVKGGALNDPSGLIYDCLVIRGDADPYWFEEERVDTNNVHGTGCTFSAAIASYLANDDDILSAVRNAKKYISRAIEEGAHYKIGQGNGPVYHFFDVWPSSREENFSTLAWESTKPILQKIYSHPFITGLISGERQQTKFSFYIKQDWHYLNQFAQALAQTALLAKDNDDANALLKFSYDANVVEQALHSSFFRLYNITNETELSPACFNYTNHLRAVVSRGNYPKALVALLPCFWVYQDVGKYIYERSMQNNPYKDWINTYSSEDFNKSVTLMIQIVNKTFHGKSRAEIEEAIKIYKISTDFEFKFWDDAYNGLVYEI